MYAYFCENRYVYALHTLWYTICGGDTMAYNETSYKASVKYKANNIKRVPLDMQKPDYERVKVFAESHGETVNGFIKRAIEEAIARDNPAQSAAE